MNIKSLAQHPSVFLAVLLLAGTLSACAPAAQSSPSSGTSSAVTPAAVATAAPTAAAPAEPTAGVTAIPAETAAAADVTSAPTTAAAEAPVAAKVNLNTATAEEILAISNTGNRMVREFQEYRPYTSITQFRQEIGKYVDEATVAGYEQYVYVPVDPNQSDAATLQQISGVTVELANALIAARPYASSDAFLAKLAESLSADQVASAKAYLN